MMDNIQMREGKSTVKVDWKGREAGLGGSIVCDGCMAVYAIMGMGIVWDK